MLHLAVDVLYQAAGERGHGTQEEIAAHAGVGRSTLARTIAGTVKPSLWMIHRLAKAYGKSVEELYFERAAEATADSAGTGKTTAEVAA